MEPAYIIAFVEERPLFLCDLGTFGDLARQLRRGFGRFHFVLEQCAEVPFHHATKMLLATEDVAYNTAHAASHDVIQGGRDLRP